MSEALKIWEEVKALQKEVKEADDSINWIIDRYKNTKGRLKLLTSSDLQQEIVEESLNTVIKPKVEKNLGKMSNLAETIKKFWNTHEITKVREEFKKVLESIKDALSTMDSYWSSKQKEIIGKLAANIDTCIKQVV